MSQTEVFEKVVNVLSPYVKNQTALASLSGETHILDDLKVNSARFVDVVLALEDEFGIAVADEEMDSVATVGDAVSLICSKLS
jgi:acyl carrier protein